MRLGEKIQLLIESRGTSQVELARSIGTYPSRVSEWVNEKGSPSLKQALRMAKVLDVPLDYLADDGLDELPSRRETEAERRVWEVVATIGVEEAWRRLVGAPGDVKVQGGKLSFPPGPAPAERKGVG